MNMTTPLRHLIMGKMAIHRALCPCTSFRDKNKEKQVPLFTSISSIITDSNDNTKIKEMWKDKIEHQ